jgi:hypothetical protein
MITNKYTKLQACNCSIELLRDDDTETCRSAIEVNWCYGILCGLVGSSNRSKNYCLNQMALSLFLLI